MSRARVHCRGRRRRYTAIFSRIVLKPSINSETKWTIRLWTVSACQSDVCGDIAEFLYATFQLFCLIVYSLAAMPPFGANCVVRHKPKSNSKVELDVSWIKLLSNADSPLNAHLTAHHYTLRVKSRLVTPLLPRIKYAVAFIIDSIKAIGRFKSFIINYYSFTSVTQPLACCLVTFQHVSRVPRFVLLRLA